MNLNNFEFKDSELGGKIYLLVDSELRPLLKPNILTVKEIWKVMQVMNGLIIDEKNTSKKLLEQLEQYGNCEFDCEGGKIGSKVKGVKTVLSCTCGFRDIIKDD